MNGKSFSKAVSLLTALIMIAITIVSSHPVQAVNYGTPILLITEIVPDSANDDGGDVYEYIEVYNATNQSIHFKDYKIHYRYPVDPNDLIWAPGVEGLVIEAGQTMVFWKKSNAESGKTVADFNANYGTELVENKHIVALYGDSSMSNGRLRTLTISTNTGHDIATATYNDGADDVETNKGINFAFPTDGSNQMVKINAGSEQATPGTVNVNQVPEQLVDLNQDMVAPTIENLTQATEAPITQGIDIQANAEDDQEVKSFTLYYKTNIKQAYTKVNLVDDPNSPYYAHKIEFLDLIGSESVEYYFAASDGFNEVMTETFRIHLIKETSSPRLNVKDGEILNGKTVIKGTANGIEPDGLSLLIDGAVIHDTFTSTGTAYFVFYAYGGIDEGYQNALTAGGDIIALVDNGPKDSTVMIPVESLHEGENVLTLRSGSKEAPYFEDNPPSGKLDDFDIGDARLVLPDGTVLRDPHYGDSRFGLGGHSKNLPSREFHFTIPSELMNSQAYHWDTTFTADGEHRVTVKDPDQNEASVHVVVDNTKPSITTLLEEGSVYTGEFTIDPVVTDQTSGVKEFNITLDEESITTPYLTSSDQLAVGDHVLKVVAVDKAGNVNEKAVHFKTRRLIPPALLFPEDGASDVDTSPELSVNIIDPEASHANVVFYEGQQYRADSANVQVYKNAVDTEPPSMYKPTGETALTDEEVSKLVSLDGEALVQDSSTQFPYVRFQVQLDEGITEDHAVQIRWEGHSLPGRQVTMYAWNHHKQKWMAIDSIVAPSEEAIRLQGKVNVQDYANEHVINVLVQDEIPSRDDYEYTFAWMTDTQYYAELYPEVFETEVHWIKNAVDDMNIQYVFHTGDLVNKITQEYQWNRADQYMGVLDEANIPYGVLAGDHDTGYHPRHVNDYSVYQQYFGADRFQDRSYYGESYKDNRGHYDLISVDGNDFIMVYMSWGIGEDEIKWMNEVLSSHSDRKAILNFHEYLKNDGTRSALGENLFQEVVKPNENVFMVLSGHRKTAQKVDEIDDDGDGTPDRKVYQLLANYQSGPNGGNGNVTLFHFDTDEDKVYINTYSTYLNHYVRAPENEFAIDVDLEPLLKRVATDYFEINVFSNQEIGEVQNVTSGQTASVDWNGLDGDTHYYWYAALADGNGALAVSEMWEFQTYVNLPVIRRLLDQYIQAGAIENPLAAQLDAKLTQAEFFHAEGSMEKSTKHMNDFLQHLNNESLKDFISTDVKAVLIQKVEAMLKVWSE